MRKKMMFLFCNPLFNPLFCPEETKKNSLITCSFQLSEEEYPSDVIKRSTSCSPTTATATSLISGSWSFESSEGSGQLEQGYDTVMPVISNLTQRVATGDSEITSDCQENNLFSYRNMETFFQQHQLILNSQVEGIETELENIQRDSSSSESEHRLQLLQQELDDIVEYSTLLTNEEMQLEDELIEALGIASNQVAYLNFTETEKSPSIAYSILHGNLLEVAAQHYFGSSNQFMLDYTSLLRATVMKMKVNGLNEPKYYHGENLEYEWVPL
jgi:hypothetical protein